MRTKNIFFLIAAIFLFLADIVCAQQPETYPIRFRSGSDILYDHYADNNKEIVALKELIVNCQDVIVSGNGHIRLVAPIGNDGKENPIAMNLAALRIAVIRSFLKQNFRMLTSWSFTIYFDTTKPSDNTIEVCYMPYAIPANVSSEIYYTNQRSDFAMIKRAFSNYEKIPYLNEAPAFESGTVARSQFDRINAIATNPVDVSPKEGESNAEKLLIAIHYRWDNDHLDSLYLSNPENLQRLDSVLCSQSAQYIDTLTIVAYASPEGQSDYNKRLSERRANTIKNYITDRYQTIPPERIIIDARGENWEGLRNLAIRDLELPSRNEVLKIIDSPLNGAQKQSLLTKLDGGVTYYRYILPNYYRYLRTGASVLIAYTPALPIVVPIAVPQPEPKIEPKPVPVLVPEPEPTPVPAPVVTYPVAFKTNLLFDVVGAPNIGIEVPIGKHFSVVGDFAYAYWRSASNLYALQTIEGGVEGRYWFGASEKKKLKNPEWEKPLKGWNLGIYGMYCGRYDIQMIDGYQGDGFWSVGITAGYALPIARNLTLDFSLAVGYFYTDEYRHYHRPQYDSNGDYHLMWQETGSFGTFTLTKARVSLVWLIRSTKKGGKR